VRTFVELGPGAVLGGLIGKIDAETEVVSAGDPAGIEAAAAALARLG